MRWVLTWRGPQKTFGGPAAREMIKSSPVARGYEDPAVYTLVNSTKLAHRGRAEIALSPASLRWRGVRQMDISAAFLKSGGAMRWVFLVPQKEAGVSKRKLWRVCRPIYGLAAGISASYRIRDAFVREK